MATITFPKDGFTLDDNWAFARRSAGPFVEREMKEKQHKEKGEAAENARESISERTPKSYVVHFLWEIACAST